MISSKIYLEKAIEFNKGNKMPIVTMPDEIRKTITECLMYVEKPKKKITPTQRIKLTMLRRLVDTCDSPTPEFIQLSDELRKELGPEYFDYCLEI